MTDNVFRSQRRRWLLALAASGAFGATGLSGLIQRAQAAGRKPAPEGVQEFKGEVLINKKPAKHGAIVKPGDTVNTGPGSHVVFVIGKDAYLLRELSRLQISGEPAGKSESGEVKPAVVRLLNLLSGKMLAAFAGGDKRITAPTVTIGIRGTGVYLEAERKRTYVCTCYGETVLESRSTKAREEVSAKYHDSPRYVYARGAAEIIAKAPVINHSDDELIMLEALLDRTPPFVTTHYERRY